MNRLRHGKYFNVDTETDSMFPTITHILGRLTQDITLPEIESINLNSVKQNDFKNVNVEHNHKK